MQIAKLFFIIITGAALLGGCGGRAPERVQIIQEGDDKMSCEELSAETARVAAEYQAKQEESDEETEHNINMTAASIIPFVGLVAAGQTDVRRGALHESIALRDRLDRLERIQDRRCDQRKAE